MSADQATDPGLLDVVWALILIQGAITLTSAIEVVVGSVAFGAFAAAAPLGTANLALAVLALVTARGIRNRRRWARKVTVIAEWFVLVWGLLNGVATVLIATEIPLLVPVLTTMVVPMLVLVLLHNLRYLFEPHAESADEADEMVLELEMS